LPTAELQALDAAHHMHPFSNQLKLAERGARVITRGEGVWLTDSEGNRILDGMAGLWCVNVGYGRDSMAEVAAKQMRELPYYNTFFMTTHVPVIALSAKLAEVAPGDLNRVHFTTCGSTAVDTAYRMVAYVQHCRGFPDKTHVIAREQSYHGATYIGQSVGKRTGDRVPEFSYKNTGIHHISAPNLYRAPDGMDEAAFVDFLIAEFKDKIAEIGAERVGAFFAEPIQASGGVIVPPKDYLRRMWEVCQKHGILFVADEVVTAFGRIGHWFASEAEFDIVPDMITCAKGLTSGYLPLGALIFSDRLWNDMAAEGTRWFTSGFTYSGHPVSCAAALKNIEIMEREDLLGNATQVGQLFEDRMKALGDLPMVGQVRGRKLMICVENVADKGTKALLPDSVDVGTRIADAAESMGLMVRPMGHLNVMSPPLTITAAEVDMVGDTLSRAIRQVADDLTRRGIKLA
jgi:putrescine aminotransferase